MLLQRPSPCNAGYEFQVQPASCCWQDADACAGSSRGVCALPGEQLCLRCALQWTPIPGAHALAPVHAAHSGYIVCPCWGLAGLVVYCTQPAQSDPHARCAAEQGWGLAGLPAGLLVAQTPAQNRHVRAAGAQTPQKSRQAQKC